MSMTKTEMVKKLAENWGDISNRQANDNLTSLGGIYYQDSQEGKRVKDPESGDFQAEAA